MPEVGKGQVDFERFGNFQVGSDRVPVANKCKSEFTLNPLTAREAHDTHSTVMHEGNQWLVKMLVGCALVFTGAAAVVCIRLAITMPDPATREPSPGMSMRRDRVISQATRAEIEALLDPARDGELNRWMERRPGEMMAYIDSLEDRERAMELAARFVRAIRNPHHDLLLDWLARQEDKHLGALVFRGMIPRLVRENPDECIAISFSLGDGQHAWDARDEFFFALPLEQRVRLVKQQKPEERAWLLSRRATGFGERAPELCLEMIGELPPSAHRGEAVAKLMKAWVNGANVYHLADPVSAVKGVMAISDPELRQESLKQAVIEWSDKNPDIASRWITKQPTGPDRDAAIDGLVTRLATADPDSAAGWAAAISDETLRRKVMGRIGKPLSGKTKEKQE